MVATAASAINPQVSRDPGSPIGAVDRRQVGDRAGRAVVFAGSPGFAQPGSIEMAGVPEPYEF